MLQILLVLYFVFNTGNYLLRRTMAQRIGEHNRLINAIFYLFFLLPAGIILAFFFPHNLHIGWLNVFLLLGGSVIWPIYYIVAFNANKEVDVGIFSIINNLSPIFTLVIALPFLDEQETFWQFIGIALLILSGIIASLSQLGKRNRSSVNGIFGLKKLLGGWVSVFSAHVSAIRRSPCSGDHVAVRGERQGVS